MRRLIVPALLLSVTVWAQSTASIATNIPYAEAKPILEALHEALPPELRSAAPAALGSLWPDWVVRRDRAIRARLEQGDETSLVNLLLFGTTFTRQPRALNDSAKLGGRERAAAIVRGRISDMVTGIAAPGSNERLQFARLVIDRQGIDPTTAAGKAQVRAYLLEAMRRMVGEVDAFIRTLQTAKSQTAAAESAARATLFRDRGLSSDTSLPPDFAIERALAGMNAAGALRPGNVRRVAVIGPGLDFADKSEGHDFYPVQTIQPFSIIDSLIRVGLAAEGQVRVTAFDVSPRILQHLAAARRRAAAGAGYVVHLPRDPDGAWSEELIAYWKQFGNRIGDETTPSAAPASAGTVQVRAVRVRPAVVLEVVAENLNIVLQRREPVQEDDRFDLVIASNIFVYYDAFEQSLALANIAAMIRPGGFLLTNDSLPALASTPMRAVNATTVVYSSRPDDNDRVIWLQRQ